MTDNEKHDWLLENCSSLFDLMIAPLRYITQDQGLGLAVSLYDSHGESELLGWDRKITSPVSE